MRHKGHVDADASARRAESHTRNRGVDCSRHGVCQARRVGALRNRRGCFCECKCAHDVGYVSCYRCGDAQYATECPHIHKICRYCRKVGHLSRLCQSRDAGSNHRASTQQFKKNNANKQVRVHAVDASHHSTPKSVQHSAVSSSDE